MNTVFLDESGRKGECFYLRASNEQGWRYFPRAAALDSGGESAIGADCSIVACFSSAFKSPYNMGPILRAIRQQSEDDNTRTGLA